MNELIGCTRLKKIGWWMVEHFRWLMNSWFLMSTWSIIWFENIFRINGQLSRCVTTSFRYGFVVKLCSEKMTITAFLQSLNPSNSVLLYLMYDAVLNPRMISAHALCYIPRGINLQASKAFCSVRLLNLVVLKITRHVWDSEVFQKTRCEAYVNSMFSSSGWQDEEVLHYCVVRCHALLWYVAHHILRLWQQWLKVAASRVIVKNKTLRIHMYIYI